jgi:hypothetical protein
MLTIESHASERFTDSTANGVYCKFWSKKIQNKSDNSKEEHFG